MVYALGRELDALFYILGIFGGIFRFGVTVPAIARFNVSAALGSPTLPVWLDLNTGIVVLAGVLMAVGAFRAGERCEGKWNLFARLYGQSSKGDGQP